MLKKLQNILFEDDDDDLIDDEELEEAAPEPVKPKKSAEVKPAPAAHTETKPATMQRIDVTQSVPIEQTKPQPRKESVFKEPEVKPAETKAASSIGSITFDEPVQEKPQPRKTQPKAAKPVRKEERVRPSYQFQPVISPIFGVDEKDMNALKTTTSKITEKERAKNDRNVSPIISPMYGANPDESPLTIQKTVEQTAKIEQMTATSEQAAAEDDFPAFSLDDILKMRDDDFTDDRREVNDSSAPLFPDLTFGEEDDPEDKVIERSIKDRME